MMQLPNHGIESWGWATDDNTSSDNRLWNAFWGNPSFALGHGPGLTPCALDNPGLFLAFPEMVGQVPGPPH